MTDSDAGGVKAARTSFAVVEAIATLDGAGVSELARYLDRSKGGVYKHLQTLTDLGYVHKDGDTYRLGIEYWTLGTTVRDRFLNDRITSVIDDLAASIGHVVTLVIYESGTAAAVYAAVPPSATVQPYAPGDTVPLHASAAGKAILAYLPDEDRERLLSSDLDPFTDATLTDHSALERTIEAVREQRLARDHGEYDDAVECVAAPIIGDDGYPRGSIAATASREAVLDDGLEADASLIVSASKSLENALTD